MTSEMQVIVADMQLNGCNLHVGSMLHISIYSQNVCATSCFPEFHNTLNLMFTSHNKQTRTTFSSWCPLEFRISFKVHCGTDYSPRCTEVLGFLA